MKYWRGYLVAAIIAACSWGLIEFAQSHWLLVDMAYPYLCRMVQNFLAEWSSGVGFCLWQVLLLVLTTCALATIVMAIIWKWSPIQVFGWITAVVSLVFFMNTALFGLNDYAGPLAQDLRLDVSAYTITELEEAGLFYRDEANKLAAQINRDASGQPLYSDFATLAAQAADGFKSQTYESSNSVFAGTLIPVKELGWSDYFCSRGITGVTVGITGEAAVNPQTPAVGLPFAICREMAKRMCITNDQDAAFAAFLACDSNSSPEFRYSAYFMAYRYCYNALAALDTGIAQAAAVNLESGESRLLAQDVAAYNATFAANADNAYAEPDPEAAEDAPVRSNVADLLTAWHIQKYVLPSMAESETLFDPLDESQVDLSGLPHGPAVETPSTENSGE